MSSRRIVLDTNVLVSAFLNPSGAPSQVLTLLLAAELRLLFDQRILDEYAEVLARPRFSLEPADVANVLRQLEADGERIVASAEVAQLAGRAEAVDGRGADAQAGRDFCHRQ